MPEDNYITRLEQYATYLRSQEVSNDINFKLAKEGSREQKNAVLAREVAKSHRIKLESLFPDIAIEE